MNDRLTKKELKEDTLVRETARAADFLAHHGRSMVGGVVVVVVVVAAVFFMRGNSTRSEDRAAGLIAEASMAFDQNDLDKAAQSLETVVSSHGGTSSGIRAELLYGDVRYAQNRYEDALVLYTKAADRLKGKGMLENAARRGMAACYENLDRYQDAAAIYTALADGAPNASLKAELRMATARNLAAAGQTDQAKSVLKDLGQDSDNPRVAQDAKLLLAELSHR